MKYSLCGILIGLTDSYINGIKTKLNAIPKVDYWKQDAQFTKSQDENGDNVVTFMFPFHKKAIRSAFVKNWIRFYWDTETIEDPETGEKIEVSVRRFEVKDKIKAMWQKCKAGSRIWIERHDHDEETPRGCKVEDLASK